MGGLKDLLASSPSAYLKASPSLRKEVMQSILLLALVATAAAAGKPHIISILQDDMGYFDSGIHNPHAVAWTQNITALARDGIVLTHHYTHWHCSPTRRSFLTGRLPIHHGEQLSPNSGDDIDLRMTWISKKLADQGYKTHWFGKMHTGFRSYRHLAVQNGFTTNVGSLQTGGSYSGPKHTTRWQDTHPIWQDSQFEDKPAQCGMVQVDAPACNTTVKQDTIMQCGSALKFVNVSGWEDCCAACTAETSCSHWVYNPMEDNGNKAPCHIKTGDNTCSGKHEGAVSGVKGAPTPGPAPGPAPGPRAATCTNEYSTDLWGQEALQAVQKHDPKEPLYVHLCFQAVHTPYDKAPGDPTGNVYRGMLWRADVYIGQLVTLLKSKGMWDNTLIVYTADNGGVGSGINYPLRGEKHSNWEGGMRTAAFVSGGFVPEAVRGTNNSVNMHIVDWYPTFATLAGADPTDNPPVAPLPVDPSDPHKNIYGDHSFPAVDGVNVWPALTQPDKYAAPDAVHTRLVLSKEVVIAGQYKLLVSQPYFKSQNSGWKTADGTWTKSDGVDCETQDISPKESALPVPHPGKAPCLFDLRADPSERANIAGKHPDIVAQLWKALNMSILAQRDCNGWTYKPIPGPNGSCSPPELLGKCNQECANNKWKAYGNKDGPICGVPGCDNDELVI